jgi:hypothetical protein
MSPHTKPIAETRIDIYSPAIVAVFMRNKIVNPNRCYISGHDIIKISLDIIGIKSYIDFG